MKTAAYYINKHKIYNNDIRYMHADDLAEIKALTPCCTGDTRERLYWLRSGLIEYPSCKQCKQQLASKSFLNGIAGYRSFCSVKCMRQSDDYKQSYKTTCLKKYGVEHSFSSQQTQDKRTTTNIMKYGDKNPIRWSSDKFKQAMKAKYGVTSALHVLKIREQVSLSLRGGYVNGGKLDDRLAEIQDLEGVHLISPYIGYDSSMSWQHASCGETFLSNLADGKIPSCPKCNGKSRPEYELYKAIEAIIGSDKIRRNDRTAIRPFELDIYLPEHQLAFELNGVYYHSELFLKDKARTYHLYKQELCRSQGITLIQIFDEEWHSKREMILDKIDSLLGRSTRIWARQLTIHQVDASTKKQFMLRNHLQGPDKSAINLALVDDNKTIVSMMTFCKPRFSKSCEWELSRYTNDRTFTVVGGASRLLKAFIKQVDPSSIVTYADARFSNGNFYTTIGFKQVRRSPPNYWYVNGDKRLSRYQAQKHKLNKLLGASFNPVLSEHDNMLANKWYRLYDCGNFVFEWHKYKHLKD